jgi:2-amino-4-hydroxy-6-hydroxymethyldihydropteridine diphosphokinase
VSELVETVAIRSDGPDDTHPNYLNGVAIVDTTLSAASLLAVLHSIEDAHGRTRTERWGDRTLDLDLIVSATTSKTATWLSLIRALTSVRSFWVRG